MGYLSYGLWLLSIEPAHGFYAAHAPLARLLALCACQQSAAPRSPWLRRPVRASARTTSRLSCVLITASTAHDRTSFTKASRSGADGLFEAPGSRHSLVHELDPRSGQELRRVLLPNALFGEGITVLGGKLYQLTWMRSLPDYDADTFVC